MGCQSPTINTPRPETQDGFPQNRIHQNKSPVGVSPKQQTPRSIYSITPPCVATRIWIRRARFRRICFRHTCFLTGVVMACIASSFWLELRMISRRCKKTKGNLFGIRCYICTEFGANVTPNPLAPRLQTSSKDGVPTGRKTH